MAWFTTLRYVVYARRAVLALERLALATERAADLAYRQWESAHPIAPRKITTDFGTLDQQAVNEQWKQEQEAQGIVMEDDGQ